MSRVMGTTRAVLHNIIIIADRAVSDASHIFDRAAKIPGNVLNFVGLCNHRSAVGMRKKD